MPEPLRNEQRRSIWRVRDHSTLTLEIWDSFTAVYDRNSGDTHLLSAVPGEVLSLLLQADDSEAGLLDRLAREHELEPNPDWHRQLKLALRQIQELGLIETGPE